MYIHITKEERPEYVVPFSAKDIAGKLLKIDATDVTLQFQRAVSSARLKLRTLDYSFVGEQLFLERHAVISSLMSKGEFNIDSLNSLNELLSIWASNNWRARAKEKPFLLSQVDSFVKAIDYVNFLEVVQARVHLLTDNSQFMLKYWQVLMDMYRNYGIISPGQRDKAFKYSKLDQENAPGSSFYLGMDLIEFFKKNYAFIISIHYILKKGYRISQINKFDTLTKYDILYVLTLFFSSGSDVWGATEDKILKILSAVEGEESDRKSFLRKMTGGQGVPICIKLGDNIVFSKQTLLFYAFYFIGIYSRQNVVVGGKQAASVEFEEQIKQKLLNMKIRTLNSSEFTPKTAYPHGYDVIAVDEQKKVLYLLEAKYRDFPPSSFSPAELLTNELDGEEGLIRFCEKQKDAVDCFVRDRPDFEQKLNFSFEGYSIKAGIVTKFAPLIKECHGIPLVEFDNLDAII